MTENDAMAKIRETLENHEKRIKSLEERFPTVTSEETALVGGKVDFEKLAKKIGVSNVKIRELFDIEDKTLTSLKVVGEGEREKTRAISLVVLLGYKYLFGNEQLLSSELKRNVAANRIPVNNFATYLNEIIPSLILRKGKTKSRKTTYKLTLLGEAEAKEILKKLCE